MITKNHPLSLAVLLYGLISFRALVSQELVFAMDVAQRGVIFQAVSQQRPGNQAFPGIAIGKGVGDVNGDGFDDLVFSVACDAPPVDGSNPLNTVFELILGRNGLSGIRDVKCEFEKTAIFRSRSPNFADRPGTIAAVGDLDHDGYDDFMISYPYYDFQGPTKWNGVAFLVYGFPDISGDYFVEDIGGSIRGILFTSSDPFDAKGQLGYSMANIGDIDADGQDDLAIGVWDSITETGDRPFAGKVLIFLKVANFPAKVDFSMVGASIPGMQVIGATFPCDYTEGDLHYEMCGESLGEVICPVGDVDGDGFDDVVLLSGAFQSSQVFRNRQYLIHGSSKPRAVIDLMEIALGGVVEGVTLIPAPGPDDVIRLGCKPLGIGDLNGDGFSDVMFGVTRLPSPFEEIENAAYIMYGRPHFGATLDIEADPLTTRIIEYEPGSLFSASLASPGDLNGDGVPDLLFGARKASGLVGEAYLLYGKKEFPNIVRLEDGFSGTRLIGEDQGVNFGNEVEAAGDFNGDKLLDYLVLCPKLTLGEDEVSRAYLVYGTGGQILPLRLDQIDPVSGPIRGGTEVTFHGQGFQDGALALFRLKPATSVHVISQYLMTAVTPPGEDLGFVDVKVTVAGKSQEIPAGYEYEPNYPDINLNDLGTSGFTLKGKLSDSLGAFVDFGDVTGDGIDDLIIWKLSREVGGIIASIVRGGEDLPPLLEAYAADNRTTTISNSLESTISVPSVSYLADVNGDSVGDLGIGQSNTAVFILFGSRTLEPDIQLDAAVDAGGAVRIDPPGGLIGYFSVEPIGDMDGDGIADFAIGSAQNSGEQGPGAIYYIHGRRDWPHRIKLDDPGIAFSKIIGTYHDQGLSYDLKDVGDVNGDGHRDLMASAPRSRDLFVDRLAYIIYGSADLPEFEDVESLVRSGKAVAIKPPYFDAINVSSNFRFTKIGDVNGDRYADVLIGQQEAGILYEGASYLIYGGPALPGRIEIEPEPAVPDGIVRFIGEAAYRNATAAGPAGDYNNDGLSDFLIGDGIVADPAHKAGNVFLILGADGYPDRVDLGQLGGKAIRITSKSPDWLVGPLVGPFGDLNGDGQTDFAIGRIPQISKDPPDVMYLHVVFGPYGDKKFIRGDANRDGQVDISDAVTILTYLFLGGDKPLCIDALDSDDSGLLDITDAIYLLGFLYTGGRPPPAPFPAEGRDSTRDVLDCLGFNP